MKFLALGGNLGPVLATFRHALQALDGHGVRITAVSGVYRTTAVTWPGGDNAAGAQAPPYWNAVCQVSTELACEAVLSLCQGLERAAGRVTGIRWGSRPLDLDLLLWDGERRDDARLTLPHPRLHERLFVLRPLCELAPDLVIPKVGHSVAACLADFADDWSGIMLRRAFDFRASAEKNVDRPRLKVAAQVIAPQDN